MDRRQCRWWAVESIERREMSFPSPSAAWRLWNTHSLVASFARRLTERIVYVAIFRRPMVAMCKTVRSSGEARTTKEKMVADRANGKEEETTVDGMRQHESLDVAVHESGGDLEIEGGTDNENG